MVELDKLVSLRILIVYKLFLPLNSSNYAVPYYIDIEFSLCD